MSSRTEEAREFLRALAAVRPSSYLYICLGCGHHSHDHGLVEGSTSEDARFRCAFCACVIGYSAPAAGLTASGAQEYERRYGTQPCQYR